MEKIDYRKRIEKSLKEEGAIIMKILSDRMKDGPPEKMLEKTAEEKTEKQDSEAIPESIWDAIASLPTTRVVGIDVKTKRPIYFESVLGDAIQHG